MSRFVVEILLLIIVNNVNINTGTVVPQTHDIADNCDGTIRFTESVILKGTNLSDISCTVAIQSSNTFNGLLLNFNALNLSNNCSDSSLEVDDVFGNIVAGPLCKGKLQEKIFKSDQSVASLKYSSDDTSTEGFSVIITSFNNGTNGKCTSSEFQCHNKLCISKELVCNQVNECSDNSDERPPCEHSDDDYITLLLEISIPIASAAVLLALCACCCCCCKKTKFYTYVRVKK